METNFSLNRIRLLLQADWIEHKKSLLLNMGVLFLVWMVILWILYLGDGTDLTLQKLFYYTGAFVALNSFCSLAGRKLHRPKGLYYTLPASNEEKYAALLLDGIIYFLCFQLVFWGGLLLWKALVPTLAVSGFADFGLTDKDKLVFLFPIALLFLSYLSFRKHAFLIAAGIGNLYLLLFSLAVAVYIDTSGIMSVNFDAFAFLSKYLIPVILVATLVVVYAGYLKLKEKEQR
jgi:hypothetical protein